MSQSASAQVLAVNPKTIARRVTRFGHVAKKHLKLQQKKLQCVDEVVFDEMESFHHTKLKPLTIPLAVEKKTRRILALEVGQIAAKGPLAALSRKKYGPRKCQRKEVLRSLFHQMKNNVVPNSQFCTDESRHYPGVVKRFFPVSNHKTFKGRKAAVVGQGEMKKGGFDPLFYLNHTAAMIRDNVKRLARRTWCTTKNVERLKDFLHLYAFYHNQRLVGIKRPRIYNCPNLN